MSGPSVAVGVDAVEIERFRRLLDRRSGLRARLFTDDELAYGARFSDSAPTLAARFAAKEAAMKALGVGLGAFGFHDVEVGRGEGGAPELRLAGAAARLAEERGTTSWSLSISHTAVVAQAVVVALSVSR